MIGVDNVVVDDVDVEVDVVGTDDNTGGVG